jgi:hypothetical protein
LAELGVARTDFVGAYTRDLDCKDPDGNALMLHHRHALYSDRSLP